MMRADENRSSVARIEALDTSVFAIQPAHYSDRTSFLRVQRLIRTLDPAYEYLEIGSDIGASLLPHLLDPCCRAAVSIDPRPELQPDERGVDFHYTGNSTARMLTELGKHASAVELGKLSTIEADASAVDSLPSGVRPNLVLIDGEHTNVAAFSDFMAVLPLIAEDALVTFHDANLVGDALQIIERMLVRQRTYYSMTILPSCVAVFGFGKFVHAVETDLAPYAEVKDAYFAAARRHRHNAVADAVIGQTEGLPGRDIASLIAWTKDIEHRVAVAEAGLRNAPMPADILRLAQALDRAEAANAAMRSKAEAFASSTSWKITAPMRAAARLLKGRSE